MKYAEARPYADPESAARHLMEIANAIEPVQGRIHIEKINGPFLFRDKGSVQEYGARMDFAIAKGWLIRHDSGTFVAMTQAGKDLFAWRAAQCRIILIIWKSFGPTLPNAG